MQALRLIASAELTNIADKITWNVLPPESPIDLGDAQAEFSQCVRWECNRWAESAFRLFSANMLNYFGSACARIQSKDLSKITSRDAAIARCASNSNWATSWATCDPPEDLITFIRGQLLWTWFHDRKTIARLCDETLAPPAILTADQANAIKFLLLNMTPHGLLNLFPAEANPAVFLRRLANWVGTIDNPRFYETALSLQACDNLSVEQLTNYSLDGYVHPATELGRRGVILSRFPNNSALVAQSFIDGVIEHATARVPCRLIIADTEYAQAERGDPNPLISYARLQRWGNSVTILQNNDPLGIPRQKDLEKLETSPKPTYEDACAYLTSPESQLPLEN